MRIWPFIGKGNAAASVRVPGAVAPVAGALAAQLTAAAGAVQADEPDHEQRYRPIEWPLVRKLLDVLLQYKWQYGLGVALGLSMTLLDMQGPRFIGWIVNYCTDFLAGRLPGTDAPGAVRHLLLIIFYWCLVAAGAIVFQRYTILVMTRAGENVQFQFRKRLFAHLQKLSMSYYDKTKLGRIISRCTSDIGSMREVNVWGLFHIPNWSMQVLVAGTMMAIYTNWRLFLAVAWLGPVIYVLNRMYLRRAAGAWQQTREGFTRVSTNLAENITGVRVVTAFNRQAPNLGVFNNLQVVNTANNVHTARLSGAYQPILEFVKFIGRVIILIYGGYLISSGTLKEVGAVVTAFLYWDWFMNPIVAFGQFYNTLMMAMAGAERVFDLLETDPDVQDLPGAKPLPRINGRVEFDHVTFGYKPERPVLHDISFTAEPGQMVALVGHTGSGKSSIISLISRFYQPQQGKILVDGNDVRYVTGESLHKQTGLVLQVNYLFSGTVLDNIRYATPDATLEQVVAAAKALGTHDVIEAMSNGYDTDVGERGANMSLGQRQLICFTRAFLADPRIFMLDEATSAVDTGTEMIVQDSLEKLLQNRTTFIVAHRLSTIMRADMILVIDQGHIIERGTHGELVDAGGRYAHLYEQFTTQSQ